MIDELKLRKTLKEHDLINTQFIKEDNDYFNQAVAIVGSMEEGTDPELIEELDHFFTEQGYKLGDFKRGIQKYWNELDNLYKTIMDNGRTE